MAIETAGWPLLVKLAPAAEAVGGSRSYAWRGGRGIQRGTRRRYSR
jgi:hypothetical protein